MIKKGRHLIRNYMTLEYDFSGIRIQESALTPVDWKLSVDLATLDKKGKKKEEIEYAASIAYQKMYYWLDTNMPSIIMVDVTNNDDLFIANLSSNIMMYCPGNPGDDIIVQLLHAKLTALADTDLIVGQIRLKGSDTSLQYTYSISDISERRLPVETEEYYTAGQPRHSVPWWDRKDGFCFEFIVHPNPTINDTLTESMIDPLDEFDKLVQGLPENQTAVIKEPAKIVQVERWKPKRVE